jgi:hypothetical protein
MGILDSLFKTKYLVFLDIEFQTIQGKTHEPYILELGIIIFEHNSDKPVLIDHANFPLLLHENLRLLASKYCTVSEKTEVEIKKLELDLHINVIDLESIKNKHELIEFIPDRNTKRLLREVIKTNNIVLISNPQKTQKIVDQMNFNFSKNRMKGKYRIIYDKIMNLYKNDEFVKKRLINPQNYLNSLKPYFNNMTLVHKEGMDIIALNKDLKKYDVKIPNKIYHKDIAVYNDYFKKTYNTAKLYESYNQLLNDYYDIEDELHVFWELLNNLLKEKMLIAKPHNPLSDTFYTIFIFLIMEKYYKT